MRKLREKMDALTADEGSGGHCRGWGAMPRAEGSWQPASQNPMMSKIVVRDFGGQLHAKYLS
jgi:hypothetical protein